MKTIGTTVQGNKLVEMSQEEHLALATLANVEAGWSELWFGNSDNAAMDYDLSEPLVAVKTFASVKHRVNVLKSLLISVEKRLEDTDDG